MWKKYKTQNSLRKQNSYQNKDEREIELKENHFWKFRETETTNPQIERRGFNNTLRTQLI